MYDHLFQVIDRLDHVQEAFEPINVDEVTIEALTRANERLMQLEFLPKLRAGLSQSEEEAQLLSHADSFLQQDDALQEITLDCVMAISKISLYLRDGLFGNDQFARTFLSTQVSEAGLATMQNCTKQQAKKIRDDIKARKDYQDYLTQYVDQLTYRQHDARMKKFEGRLDKYATAMRQIRLEMQ